VVPNLHLLGNTYIFFWGTLKPQFVYLKNPVPKPEMKRMSHLRFGISDLKSGIAIVLNQGSPNYGPRPTKPFHPAREAVSFGRKDILSIMKKFIFTKHMLISLNVTYHQTITLRKTKMPGPQTVL